MRKLLVPALIALTYSVWLRPAPVQSGGANVIFPLSISGKAIQTDIIAPAGFKPIAGKVNDKVIAAILRGENTSDYSVPFLDVMNHDGSGRFYLFFDGRQSDGSVTMRVATNQNGTLAASLTGAVTQDGIFWIAGKYDVPGFGLVADAFATGKVKFAKGTFEPQKITGTLHFVSNAIGEGFTVKFKTLKPGPI